jgi:hypothetical protein
MQILINPHPKLLGQFLDDGARDLLGNFIDDRIAPSRGDVEDAWSILQIWGIFIYYVWLVIIHGQRRGRLEYFANLGDFHILCMVSNYIIQDSGDVKHA